MSKITILQINAKRIKKGSKFEFVFKEKNQDLSRTKRYLYRTCLHSPICHITEFDMMI